MILSIDTASPLQSAALIDIRNGDPCVVSELSSRQRHWAEGLVSHHIRELLDKGGAGLGDLTAVVAVRGPGSFTGIRIGLSVALGLCQSRNLRAATVSTHDLLDVYAQYYGADAQPANSGARMVCIVDALRGRWFARPAEAPGVGSTDEIVIVSATDPLVEGASLRVGFGADALPGRGIEPSALAPLLGRLESSALRSLDQPPLSPADSLSRPLYLQSPALRRARSPR